MIGALDEAAMSIANADDTKQEKADVRKVIHNLIDGLLITSTFVQPSTAATRSQPGGRRDRRASRTSGGSSPSDRVLNCGNRPGAVA
jgi:hypothetical protein